MRAAFGTGSAPVGLAILMNDRIKLGISSWYQSERVSTISSSYWFLYGDFGSWIINAPRSPSGYWPGECEWYQYVPGCLIWPFLISSYLLVISVDLHQIHMSGTFRVQWDIELRQLVRPFQEFHAGRDRESVCLSIDLPSRWLRWQ